MAMGQGSAAVLGSVSLALVSACLGGGNGVPVGSPSAAAATSPVAGEAETSLVDAPGPDEQPYAMTISGGLSLGSYEAGLNWAVVELMRNHTPQQAPRLLGVTGASAGSINALLTAIRWCDARTTSTVDDNPFATAWLPVGFDTLLPAGRDLYHEDGEPWPKDLLLSRKNAFAAIIGNLETSLERPGYRKDCSLKVGFTVTSKTPHVLSLRGLRVGNQRFVIPLVASVVDGRLRFTVDTAIKQNERKDLLGNLLFLAPDPREPTASSHGPHVVAHKDVIRAALASSAFPLAFGPVDLSYCAPRAECPRGDQDVNRNRGCRRMGAELEMADAVACRRKFMDGGVFDNVPLGVAMAQIESRAKGVHATGSHRPLRYIYMYPGNRREPKEAPGGEARPAPVPAPPAAPVPRPAPAPSTPLRDTIDFAGGFVDTASEYELHNVLRYNLWNAGTPQLAAAVAAALDENAAREAEGRPPTPAEDRDEAARLTSVTSEGSIDRIKVAAALLAGSRALERITSQEAAGSDASRDLVRSDYTVLRDDILAAVVRICSNPDGTANARCGQSARELLIQASALQSDPRNERHLMLSRRFSPIAGTHIGHFGAFLDRPFRDYDYYAGIYDALWSVADMSCKIQRARVTGTSTDEVQQQAQVKMPEPIVEPPIVEPGTGDPTRCLRVAFTSARDRLRIRPGTPAHAVTERLWYAEHGGRLPAGGDSQVEKTMTALFDPQRCRESDSRAGRKAPPRREPLCLRDLDLAAFARALERAKYQANGDAPFVRWVLDHPEGGWWALPGVFAAGRLLEVSRAENMGNVAFGSVIAESYLESYVDQHSTGVFVAPSSLPDRKVTRWAGLLFPFAAFSLHPTRRFELGLLRGGIRVGPKADLSGWDRLLPWDLLGELSARVTVRKRGEDEEDQGYGLFTRGATTLHASFAPTLRLGGIFWSLGLRAGAPVPLGPLRSQIAYRDQINTEVVATFLGDKLRFAVGCNPLQDAPGDHCWRDLYYSFGVNDLAGLVYWTGMNPYKLDRLFVPFVAARVTTDSPSAEIGLVRAGWQPWPALGIWADASLVTGAETTGNASIAYEAEIVEDRWRIGLRGGYPLSIRDDARVKASHLELVLTMPLGLRLAAGAFPFDVAKDDVSWVDASYVSLGWDPGSIALQTARWLD